MKARIANNSFDSFLENENEKAAVMMQDLSNATEDDVNEAINRFCNILDLDISGLGILYDKPFQSKTTMAAYDRRKDILIINPNYMFSKDLIFFSVAHELRHKWQNEHKGEEAFANYKSRLSLNLDKYNEQEVEIDANAFALAAMDSLYKCWDIRIKIKCNGADVRKDVLQTDGVSKRYEELMEQYFS